jgi:hypothetical protein
VSVFCFVKADFYTPMLITAMYAFLCIQLDGMSVRDFIIWTLNFLIMKPQIFYWKEVNEP